MGLTIWLGSFSIETILHLVEEGRVLTDQAIPPDRNML